MSCFYINSIEGEVKGRKVGLSGTYFEYLCKTILFHIDTKWKRHVDGHIFSHFMFYFFSCLKSFFSCNALIS
jgi:hypothetical protein